MLVLGHLHNDGPVLVDVCGQRLERLFRLVVVLLGVNTVREDLVVFVEERALLVPVGPVCDPCGACESVRLLLFIRNKPQQVLLHLHRVPLMGLPNLFCGRLNRRDTLLRLRQLGRRQPCRPLRDLRGLCGAKPLFVGRHEPLPGLLPERLVARHRLEALPEVGDLHWIEAAVALPAIAAAAHGHLPILPSPDRIHLGCGPVVSLSVVGCLHLCTLRLLRGSKSEEVYFRLFGFKNFVFKPKTHRAHSTPEFYIGLLLWLDVLLLIQSEVLVIWVQRVDHLDELLALVAESIPLIHVGLVESLVVRDKRAVVGRKAERVLAVFVALLLRLVRLVLEAVVLCHFLSDGGPLLLKLIEPDLVRHDEQKLMLALLEVLERLFAVRDLVLDG